MTRGRARALGECGHSASPGVVHCRRARRVGAVASEARAIVIEAEEIGGAVQLGGIVVAQVLGAQMVQVGFGQDKGAARFGHLGAVHGQEPVGVHPARGAKV